MVSYFLIQISHIITQKFQVEWKPKASVKFKCDDRFIFIHFRNIINSDLFHKIQILLMSQLSVFFALWGGGCNLC